MAAFILTDLRHFLLLAEELHFGRTAERIGVAQPVLTRRIHRLEAAVGAKLLERTSRSVALTTEGRRLRDDAGPALRTLDRSVASVKRAPAVSHQPLRVGFFAAIEPMLPQLVERWRTALGCPVELFHLHSAQQVRQLRDRSIDIGFLRPPASKGDLETSLLWNERIVCVVPRTHRLASAGSVRLTDLEGERLVRFSAMIGTLFQRRIEAEIRKRGVAVLFGQSVQNTHSVQSLVAMSEGVALLPEYVAATPRAGLAYVPVDDLPAMVPLVIAHRSDEAQTTILNAVKLTLKVAADAASHARGATGPELVEYAAKSFTNIVR